MELLIVVLIIGLLASMALPRFGASIARARADAAARRITTDLEFARHRAILKGASQAVKFDVATNSYNLPDVPHLDHPDSIYAVSLAEMPYEAQLTKVTLGGDATIIFDGFGVPDSRGDIEVRVGSDVRVITVDGETGVTSVAEP